jgi:hypothetical protein
MQGRTNLSYFPPNPYKHPEPRIQPTREMRRMIRASWTTAPAWWIHLLRLLPKRKPVPEPPFVLTPQGPLTRKGKKS